MNAKNEYIERIQERKVVKLYEVNGKNVLFRI